jgi:ribose transport system substrate-binding protein
MVLCSPLTLWAGEKHKRNKELESMTIRKNWLKKRALGAVGLFATAGLLLAACAPAAEEAPAETEESTTESADDGRAAMVKKAEEGAMELITAGFAENEWLGPDSSPTPIQGAKVGIIAEQMASTGASRPANAVLNIGAELGWETKIYDGRGDPVVQNAAVNTAVDEGMDAIVLIFVDTTRVQAGLTRAIEAGIPVITFGSLRNTPDTVPDVSFDWDRAGRGIGEYMLWKSEGDLKLLQMKNTDLLVVYEGQYGGSQTYIEENCPECITVTEEYALANFNDPNIGVAAQAAAAMQANPELEWVSCFDSCMFRVMEALTRAGLEDKVKGAGYDCNPENVSIIVAGGIQKVCFADPREMMAWAAVDNVNRLTNGEPIFDYTSAIPIAMFDQESLSQLSDEDRATLETEGWQGNLDFQSEFRKIWGLN